MTLTMKRIPSLCAALLFFPLAGPILAKEILVENSRALQEALTMLEAGDTVAIAPGNYSGGLRSVKLSGEKDLPITIQAADTAKPPRFQGGNTAFHFSSCRHLVLRDLIADGYPGNGMNIDDGGDIDSPSENILLERLRIENTGPKGNHDALKLSGIKEFTVKNCQFVGWGGSGIDMVGCHQGTIASCHFEGRTGFSQSNAVQMKGGSSQITVRDCFFKNAGERAINLGGSTGIDFFRPVSAAYEATDIEVTGNRFVGSMAPIAWVGSKNGHVHHNTIYLPEKWAGRILQENTAERFEPCSDGTFENNLIVYDRRVRVFFNVGGKTDPESFSFKNNAWFQIDAEETVPQPRLPVTETGGVYQIDPMLESTETAMMKSTSQDASLNGKGAGRN